MTTITTLPTPPSRSDPATFSTRADAFLGALPTFATEANTVAGEVNANATAASAAATAASAATGVSGWQSGYSYASGAAVWSLIDFQTYRRKSAGSSATDPANDPTNWTRIAGDLLDVAITGTGTSNVGTRELCAATGTITRTIPAGLAVGARIGYKDAGQQFTANVLTIVPPSGHRIETLAVDESLTVSTNYLAFELRQTAAGIWRIF